MAVDAVTFFLAAWLLFPALSPDEFLVRLFHLDVVEVPDYLRTLNFCLSSGVAFLISNAVAYGLNVLFVFERGRHSRGKELGLFYLVSAVSVGIGVLLGAILIRGFGLSAGVSYIAKAVSTTLINFVARKYLIFNR